MRWLAQDLTANLSLFLLLSFSTSLWMVQLAVVTLGYQILPKLGVDVSSTVNHMISSLVPAMALFVVGKQLH